MAGILASKTNPKKIQSQNAANSNEILKDSQSAPKTPQKLTLRGILGLNQRWKSTRRGGVD